MDLMSIVIDWCFANKSIGTFSAGFKNGDWLYGIAMRNPGATVPDGVYTAVTSVMLTKRKRGLALPQVGPKVFLHSATLQTQLNEGCIALGWGIFVGKSGWPVLEGSRNVFRELLRRYKRGHEVLVTIRSTPIEWSVQGIIENLIDDL